MHQRAFVAGGWPPGRSSLVVRRAYQPTGDQWNVQIVRGKLNSNCLWNACKALSLGLLLMVLGSAMATIGYYADALSMAMETRGNHTVQIKNESRVFHLNNLSYAGPIVMGVGGFIVVAACVMTFEARDSAAKIVPTRFKWTSPLASPTQATINPHIYDPNAVRNSIAPPIAATTTLHIEPRRSAVNTQRRNIAQSFMQFSKGFPLKAIHERYHRSRSQHGLISKSPSAPDLLSQIHLDVPIAHHPMAPYQEPLHGEKKSQKTVCAPPSSKRPKRLHRFTLSVDETAVSTYRCSNESLQDDSSHGSLTLDLHLDYPVTLRVRDKRRHPLQRQKPIDDESAQHCSTEDINKKYQSQHNAIPSTVTINQDEQLMKRVVSPDNIEQRRQSSGKHQKHRRSSNVSDPLSRSRSKRRDGYSRRERLQRAISSDSRLTGHHQQHSPRPFHSHSNSRTSSTADPPPQQISSSETNVHKIDIE